MTPERIREYVEQMAAYPVNEDAAVYVLGNALLQHIVTQKLPDEELNSYMKSLLDGIMDTAANMREML